jgi:NAD(P)-dependent dehydrogenase (short-subunit alcohol dehydrogenase family)
MDRLAGRVAIVTGGASGIGRGSVKGALADVLVAAIRSLSSR